MAAAVHKAITCEDSGNDAGIELQFISDSHSISRCVGPSAEGYDSRCHRGAEAFCKAKMSA